MRPVVPLLALALLAGSCSNRERANPLDAANPNTGGAPQDFNALADASLVQLRWLARPDLAIDGFQVFRLVPGDSNYRPLGGVLTNVTFQFFDSGVQPGLEYRYRIYYVIGGALGARFAEDVATPGLLAPWVVDPGRGRLVRLCPDGRDVLFARAGFNDAGALAVTPGRGPVWVADEQAGTLDILDPSQLLGPRVRGLGAPASIALDPIDGTGWVTDRVGSVRHFRADGSNALPTTLNALLDPVAIATDPTSGAVWVTEFGGNRLRRYLRDGLPDGARALAAPSRVAVDSTTGEAWVSSLTSGWVWRVSPGLTVLDSLQFQSAIGIAIDWRRRQAWLCDVNADQLVAIDMNTHAVKFRVPGLGAPWDAAVDLATGDVWVVTRGSGRAFRLSVTGQQISSVGGFGDPFAIRLDPGF